ncbi:MAG: hypothetical protein HZA10_02520 [Nitrospirae bacterium]|nr:hypothetical protein [Nitrospirota bacterium]
MNNPTAETAGYLNLPSLDGRGMKGRVKKTENTPTLALPHQGGGISGDPVARPQRITSSISLE